MLTREQRHDRHDIDPRELKLIRVGHVLWGLYKKERGKTGNVREERALERALEQVWDLKRKLRAELRAERVVKSAVLAERFRIRRAA